MNIIKSQYFYCIDCHSLSMSVHTVIAWRYCRALRCE